MKTFFKLLLLIVLTANLLLLFVFDRLIPTEIQLPFDFGRPEPAVAEETVAEIQKEDMEEEAAAEEPAEEEEPAAEPDAEPEADTVFQEPEEEALPVCRIISAGGSNVRTGPGSGYEVVGVYPYDTVLSVTGEAENGWYPVRTEDGTEGYIFESQITIPEEAGTETGGQDAGQM